MLGRVSDNLCTVESRNLGFVVHSQNGRKIKTATFLGCETFSLTSQKDAGGHQKGQAQCVVGYLLLLGQR
jgi:hypothetical protein